MKEVIGELNTHLAGSQGSRGSEERRFDFGWSRAAYAGAMDLRCPADGRRAGAPAREARSHLKQHKKTALAEIRRVLKPGGRLLIVVWVPGWTTFSLANVVCFLLTSKAGWRRLAAEVGFSIAEEGTFNGMWFAVLERPR